MHGMCMCLCMCVCLPYDRVFSRLVRLHTHTCTLSPGEVPARGVGVLASRWPDPR